MYIYIHIYMYIYRERELRWNLNMFGPTSMKLKSDIFFCGDCIYSLHMRRSVSEGRKRQ